MLTLVIVAFGWRSGVVAVGVVALAWSSIWLGVGRLGSFAPRYHDPDAGRATWPMLLSSRTVLGALVATFAQGALAAVVFTWLPSYFQIGLGFSAQASGVLFALPSVMAVIALFVIGGISDGMLRRGRSARTARPPRSTRWPSPSSQASSRPTAVPARLPAWQLRRRPQAS